MARVLHILSTETADIDTVTDLVVAAKGRPWIARIVADVPVHVAYGVAVAADTADAVITEFETVYLSIPAESDLSVLGTDVGTVWVSEVKFAG